MKGFASRIHVFEYTNGSSYNNSQCSVHPRSDMSSIRHWCIIFAAIGLLCLSSCFTPDSHRPALPGEARFDPEAGRGGLLRLKVHLADGEGLGCVVGRSEEDTAELQSLRHLVRRLQPISQLFPYTTLFRSVRRGLTRRRGAGGFCD